MQAVMAELARRHPLTEPERMALSAAFSVVRVFEPRALIVGEGDDVRFVGAVVSGLAARYKSLPGGERQTISFLLPGDVFDVQALAMGRFDYGVAALSTCRVAVAPAGAAAELLRVHPGVSAALWRQNHAHGAVFREWVVNCGRRSAYRRVAHLICELVFQTVGQPADGQVVRLPVTQQDLADATGLSTVHINRTLQQLRADGLVFCGRGAIEIGAWDGLTAVAGFDPAYLLAGRLSPAPAGAYGSPDRSFAA